MRSGGQVEICEHYSHVLRSPLGVALGVINDLLEGYQVGTDDMNDAKAALLRILALLDEMRDLGKQPVESEGA